MHKIVEGLGYVMHGLICYEHVDDLSHVVESPCHMEVYNACIEIGHRVKEGVEDIDACLSDKSILLSNHRVGAHIVTALNNAGICISSAKTGEI